MPVYSNITFYDADPVDFFSTLPGATRVYTGPADPTGTATITDNQTGANGDTTLEDDASSFFGLFLFDGNGTAAETATATVTVGGLTSPAGTQVDAEIVWTLRDVVTGQEFQVVQFQVESGAAAGNYLLSEVPLIVGRAYETLEYDTFPLTSAGDPVFTYEDFFDNEAVDGTSGDDTIDLSYTDPQGQQIDNGDGTGPGGQGDTVFAGDGNDTVEAGEGDDFVYGEGGDDTLLGQAGDDFLFGDTTDAQPVTEFLDWTDEGGDGTNLEGEFTQNTGLMDVTVIWTDNGNAAALGASVTTDPQFTEASDPFESTSGLLLEGADGQPAGPSPVSTTTISFAAVDGSITSDEVQNVNFRINDIDAGSWIDTITVTAIDANGQPVTVEFNVFGNETVSGSTITAGGGNDQPDQAAGSVLIQIPGPVAQITIEYGNNATGGQIITVSDIYFDTIPAVPVGGDDILDGGLGADTMFGEGGDDTLIVSDGDTADGGSGDDFFQVTDLGEANATITIVGGENGETNGDTLNLGGLITEAEYNAQLADILANSPADNAGGFSGTFTLTDGTVVNFSEIENFEICYATGTLIDTPDGPRTVESLSAGDLVMTVDGGPQEILWASHRERALDDRADDEKPVLIKAGALGAGLPAQDLIVSPQHRILVGEAGQLTDYFDTPALVAAKALVSLHGIRHMRGKKQVRWHHFACRSHEVVKANGCLTESLLLGAMVLRSMTEAELAELTGIFGTQLSETVALNGKAARRLMPTGETRRLLTKSATCRATRGVAA
jgi:hypothetical protein